MRFYKRKRENLIIMILLKLLWLLPVLQLFWVMIEMRERERESGEVEASIKMKPAITTGTNIGIIVYLDNAFGYKNISLSMS